jgi:hypothetical protein
VEQLEDRTVPANFTVSSVSDLIADVNAANLTPEADTITLAPGKTFTLTAVNNTYDGATGLPFIAAAGGSLTIVGNGDVIQRSTAKGTPAFRLLDVGAGASLTVENLTLQGGLAGVSGLARLGGAIFTYGGELTLRNVTLQNNVAQGAEPAYGGGIYSYGGVLSLEGCTIRNNQVIGFGGFFSKEVGSVNGRDAFGGGLYAAGGSVTLRDTTITGNAAKGGVKGSSDQAGKGIGGGLFIYAGTEAYLDAFTAAHVTNNKASTSDPNIAGSYVLLS